MLKRLLKKCIFLVAILTSVSLISNAISLYELQHSDQYKLVYSANTKDIYINLSSVQSLRYNPPYYTLKYQMYLVDYNDSTISLSNFISNYNYNFSIEGIAESQNLYELSFNDAKPYLIKAKRKDSGIKGSFQIDKLYDLEGRLRMDFDVLVNNDYAPADYSYANPFYRGAAYAFDRAYNKVF